MKNKPLIVCILLAALLTGLSACGGQSAAEPTAAPTQAPAEAHAETAAPEATPEPTEAPEAMDADAILDYLFDAVPIELQEMENLHLSQRSDGAWIAAFDSAYGEFLYILNQYTGEIIERDEPDVEEQIASGAAQMLTAEQVREIVREISPVAFSEAKNFKVSYTKDMGWIVTFGSDFGDFFYVVDAYTGEILEREEPDVEGLIASGEVQQALSENQIFDLIYKACPIKPEQMKNIKLSSRSDGKLIVTFGSDYGDFLYIVDVYTGEILEREEPDVEGMIASGAARKALSFQEILDAIAKKCPVRISEMRDIHTSTRPDGAWVVTFGSDLGDYLYVIDPYTGQILDSTEP